MVEIPQQPVGDGSPGYKGTTHLIYFNLLCFLYNKIYFSPFLIRTVYSLLIMQPTLSEETGADEVPALKKCISCGSDDILPGLPNALCSGCREKYIKFPFPTWIKAFGAGVGLVVLFSLFSFFDNVQTGIHMERGVRAEHKHLYLTAQREFEQVLKKVPTHVEAKAHLLIAAFYNHDLSTMIEASKSLQGKILDDQELYAQADNTVAMAGQFFPSDSLNAVYTRFEGDTTSAVKAAIEDYYRRSPTDISAGLQVANDALAKDEYTKADALLHRIITEHPGNIAAITLMSSVKRYKKDSEGALKYIEQLLAFNHQDLYALSSKARIMIMMKKDDEALKLARDVEKLDGANPYNMATLAIVYHYTNKVNDRDKIIDKARANKDSSVMYYMQYAIDIVNNKEKLRS